MISSSYPGHNLNKKLDKLQKHHPQHTKQATYGHQQGFYPRTVNLTNIKLFFKNSCASACKTKTTKNQPQQKLQHTTNWEQDDRCGNSSTQSQAPEDGYINIRNMLSA